MDDPEGKPYGEGRSRAASVSYAEIERAAIAILKGERRPSVESVREMLGRGAPETIGNALKRFWRDLGVRIEGDPAALSRMPPDIADLADGMWQKALRLAGEAASVTDNAAKERLAQLQMEAELRAQSFEVREREYDAAARAREKALADSREHLLLLMKTLAREQETVRAQEARIADLEAQLAQAKEQLAAVITAAVVRHRTARKATGRPVKAPKRGKSLPKRAAAAKRKAPGKEKRPRAGKRRGRR